MDRGRSRKNNTVSNRYCTVPQCKNKQTLTISLHLLPKKDPERKEWIRILRYGKKTPKNCFVCSEHFTENDFILPGVPTKRRCLKKGALPSRKIPKTSLEMREESNIKKKQDLAAERRRRYESRNVPETIEREVEAVTDDLHFCKVADEDILLESSTAIDEEISIVHSDSEADAFVNSYDNDAGDSAASVEKIPRTKNVEARIFEHHNYVITSRTKNQSTETTLPPTAEMGIQVNQLDLKKKKSTILDLLHTAKDLHCWTGIEDFPILDTLEKTVQLLFKNNKDFDSIINDSELPLREKIVLTFIKLKLDLSLKCLGVLFGVSSVSCSRYYSEMVQIIGVVLKCVVRWPSKEKIKGNIPKFFAKYMETRAVLSSIDILTQKSEECVNCKFQMYSRDKKTETIKLLIGVAPSGLITFVSKPFGGGASNEAIFNQSGLLELVTPHEDALMVDKGFEIENECLANNIKFFRLSEESSTNVVDVAALKVHVEKAFKRLRNFKILSGNYPFTRIHDIENVMYIIAGIINLSRPILSDDQFFQIRVGDNF